MAITLRNKAIEERIRAIGRRTGEGPSAVIARLVMAEQPEANLVSEEEAARRDAWWREHIGNREPWTPVQLAASKRIEEEMYDENGLPR